jgi:DNA-binding response OmpR family regulator
MRTLIAADRHTRLLVAGALEPFNLEIVLARDGSHAWELLQRDNDIAMVIVDRAAGGIDGLELCRRLRQHEATSGVYALLLTQCHEGSEVVAAFEAGADDHARNPPEADELRSRVRIALRILSLQRRLRDRIRELQARSSELHGLMPICSYCKQVHPDDEQWLEVDEYIARHSDMKFTHHICPRCFDAAVKERIG